MASLSSTRCKWCICGTKTNHIVTYCKLHVLLYVVLWQGYNWLAWWWEEQHIGWKMSWMMMIQRQKCEDNDINECNKLDCSTLLRSTVERFCVRVDVKRSWMSGQRWGGINKFKKKQKTIILFVQRVQGAQSRPLTSIRCWGPLHVDIYLWFI